MTGSRAFFRTHWVLLTVLVLGVLSVSLLVITNQISERERRDVIIVDAVEDMRFLAARFHLWLEEAVTGDETVDMKEVFRDFEQALYLSEAILIGGVSKHGLTVHPLTCPIQRGLAENVKSLLASFKTNGLQRHNDPSAAGIGSVLDQNFDAIYKEIEVKTQELERRIETDQAANRTTSRRLFWGILIVWTFVVGAAIVGLRNHERRRTKAENGLWKANDQLRSQAEELVNHREHLVELVEERTKELKETNRALHLEIAERTRTYEALRESKSEFHKLSLEFHTLLEAITDPLTLLSPDLKVLWTNRSSAQNMQADASGLTEQHCYMSRHNRSAPCDRCPAVKAFTTGKEATAQMESPDGRHYELRAYPVKDEAGKVINVLTVAVDMTEKIALQAETMRAANLAALGELAAGVAHEINNPINGIINYAQIMADSGNEANAGDNIPSRIIKEGKRISNIVKSLLSFARESKQEKGPLRVHEVLNETLALTDNQLRKDGIVLGLNVPEKLPEITAHFQQLQQVFLNIINNARYALNQKYPGLDNSKRLEISGEEVTVGNQSHLRITFYDRGVGIPATVIHKVMDPFFSTKPKGLGTGLGLSLTHGIVSDHGGRLAIDSVEGEFTKVTIYLPISGPRMAQSA